MGEIEEDQVVRPSIAFSGSRFAHWFFPDRLERMLELENQLYDKAQQLALQLQRARRQNRQLMRDMGVYKDKWQNLVVGDYNPEEIGYDEYKKMLNYDSQVIAGWELLQTGVLMKEWKITHPDEEIVKTLTNSLEQMMYPDFRGAMKEMLKAVAYGFTVTEVVYEDYKGKWWMPRQKNGLKTFDPETITFFSDEFGNLQAIEQKNIFPFRRSAYTRGTGLRLPLDRIIVWTHEREWGNWYGKGLLRGCYKNWYIKDAMLKFANIAYERFGSPVYLGITASLQDIENMQEQIQRLYARSQAVIRKTDERDPTDIKLLESSRSEMPFDRYIRYHDEMILRRMLIGQRIFEGGGGTYGPKVPLDIIFMRLEDFRQELVDAVNHLLKMITDLNWLVEQYPQFEFAPLTTQDQQAIARGIYDAIDRELIEKDEPWIRPFLGYPAKERAKVPGSEDKAKEDEE